MSSLSGVGPLLWQRIAAGWRLLAVLSFGILVAATLLAASPIYTRVMDDLGLERALGDQLAATNRNGLVRFQLPLGSSESAAESKRLATMLYDRIGWLSASEVRYGALANLTLRQPGQPISTDPLRTLLTLQTSSDLEQHLRVTDGRLPQPTSDPANIEAVIPAQAARYLNLKPGDRIAAAQGFTDCDALPPPTNAAEAQARARFPCLPQAGIELNATITVVGFVEKMDEREGYWSAVPTKFERPAQTDDAPAFIPVILDEETFYRALPLLLPNVPSQFRLTSFADLSRIDSGNLGRTRSDLSALRRELEDAGAVPDLAMAGPLGQFQARASFNQVPLVLLLLQVVGIAFYYVLLVASLLAERRAEETAVLRSRGAGVGQVVLLATAEAAGIAFVAALLAPFLAAAAVALLGKTGAFGSVSGGDLLPFKLLPASFLFALGGALIAAVAVVIPTYFSARQGMALFLRNSSRPRRSFLQRYYIDLLLVGLAALGFWEMNQRGSVFDARGVGGWSADPLVLLSPLLLMVAVGALMFRFLPLLLGLVSRLVAGAGSGAGMTLGLWQLTRSPARYTQLALLVVMAAAVGTFAATYGSTTEESQDQRALFASGADVRLAGFGNMPNGPLDRPDLELRRIEGVEQMATAYRGSYALGPLGGRGASIPVLAVDPAQADDLLWFRRDFADQDFDALLRQISGSAVGESGLVLPGEPQGIALWVQPSAPRPGVTLWARTLDAAGTWRMAELGGLDFEGYRRLEARFSPRNLIVYPVSITGLILTQVQSAAEGGGSLHFDDVSAIEPDGDVVVEDFEAGFRWDVIQTATRSQDTVRQSGGAHTGSAAAELSFRVGSGVAVRGVYFNAANVPLPAIASKRFMENTGAQIGSQVGLVMGPLVMPVSIQAVTDLFPTMDDADPGFLILNQQHLYYYTGLVNLTGSSQRPNEAWLKMTGDPSLRPVALGMLRDRYGIPPAQIIDSKATLASTRSDPLIRASGGGILLIALLAATSLLALGFGLTLYLGGVSRSVEVSVMRAVGLSPGQVFTMIALEYLLVAAIGLVIGTLTGLRISETMLSFLDVSEDGRRVVPPFELVTRWDTVALAFAATGVAFAVSVAGLALYFLRLPVSRLLRSAR